MASSLRSNADGTMSVLNGSGTEVLNVPSTANAVSTTVATQGDVIGVGQTWQDVTASRAFGVTYTNTTGKPIEVNIRFTITGGWIATFNINGSEFTQEYSYAGSYSNITAIVPNNSTYSFIGTTGIKWQELR